jgi:siroheme synthase-like protein
MTYYPFYMNIDNKKWLIVGGGTVAAGRFSRLLEFTDKITVMSPEISSDITDKAGGTVRLIRSEYDPSFLKDADICLAATSNHELNRKIAMDCRALNILVNASDDPKFCDFIFPAVLKKGNLTVSVSTGGSSPRFASLLRDRISDIIPDGTEEILDKMMEIRRVLSNDRFEGDERKKVLKNALDILIAENGEPSIEDVLSRSGYGL